MVAYRSMKLLTKKQTHARVGDALDHLGTRPLDVAVVLDVHPSNVGIWRSRGWIPASRAVQIEALTSGRFRAIDLVERRWVGK